MTRQVGWRKNERIGAHTFQRRLGRRTARCSFLRSEGEVREEEGEGCAVRMEVARV